MITQQYNLTGGVETVGDVPAKVRHLLENMPETRDSYPELVGNYWLEFDGLDGVIPPEYHEALLRFMRGAKSWKTIVNWCRRIQREHPELAPSPEAQARRAKQSTQGRVR